MNRETAALGIPVYTIFRGKIGAVDRHLQQEGRPVLIESVEDIRKRVVLTLRRKNERKVSDERPALQAIVEDIKDITKSRSVSLDNLTMLLLTAAKSSLFETRKNRPGE
jgi:predicted glycosyltransferase